MATEKGVVARQFTPIIMHFIVTHKTGSGFGMRLIAGELASRGCSRRKTGAAHSVALFQKRQAIIL